MCATVTWPLCATVIGKRARRALSYWVDDPDGKALFRTGAGGNVCNFAWCATRPECD